jgi:capsular exopolysaccharide synthesis family protein
LSERVENQEDSTFEQLLAVLRRRWRLLLGCIVLVTACAIGFSMLQKHRYTASASLLFSDAQFDQELFGTNFTPDVNDPTQQQATNIDLVSLPIVAERTAQALHLDEGIVAGEVSVSGVGQSNIAQINVTDPDPVRAAQIANTYAQQFVLYRQQADRSKIAGAEALVNQELAALPASQRYGSVGTALQNRANELGVLAALQTGDAEVAQPASVPTSPSTPRTRRNALLGALLGLLLGMGLVFVAERLDKRVRDPSELEAAYGLPILGVIPESDAYQQAGVDPLPPIEAEAFALLRARLRYFNVDREVRSLLMTSSAPGEGKTTVALNLAIAEALAGNEKVVVVEADLRRPSLAKRVKIDAGPGLAEILSKNATLDSALQSVVIPTRSSDRTLGFSVLTAGAIPPNPTELLESRAMIDLLTALTERFNLVVMDSAPTTAVSDAIPLLQLVSGVVIVNRVDAVTRDVARHLRDQLAKLNAPVLGLVANALPSGRDQYGYGYGAYAYTNAYVNGNGDGNGEGNGDSNGHGQKSESGTNLAGLPARSIWTRRSD